MTDPKDIITTKEGASYYVPVYKISEEGLVDEGRINLQFCKGNKADPKAHRQPGFLTETLLTACKQYLVDVNKGDLKNDDSELAILHIQLALDAIDRRAAKRKAAGVQGTYEPVKKV